MYLGGNADGPAAADQPRLPHLRGDRGDGSRVHGPPLLVETDEERQVCERGAARGAPQRLKRKRTRPELTAHCARATPSLQAFDCRLQLTLRSRSIADPVAGSGTCARRSRRAGTRAARSARADSARRPGSSCMDLRLNVRFDARHQERVPSHPDEPYTFSGMRRDRSPRSSASRSSRLIEMTSPAGIDDEVRRVPAIDRAAAPSPAGAAAAAARSRRLRRQLLAERQLPAGRSR